MKFLLLSLVFFGCAAHPLEKKYVFFLHNRYLQLFPLGTSHPEYGQVEYQEIVSAFEKKGFTLISEIRPTNTDWRVYARKVAGQVDSLLKSGVKPSDITLVGTSMGGYITKSVSSILANKDINYVLIGCCLDGDITDDPDIELCGNILSIYEATDPLGRSCQKQKEYSKKPVPHYKEIELHTGIKHGFLYKALSEWIEPAAEWAQRNYELRQHDDLSFTSLNRKIDSVLQSEPDLPFNGIITVTTGTTTNIARSVGFEDTTKTRPLLYTDEFIIGSISKQITAVLAMREFDKGRLRLDLPIRAYLPELRQPWADTVTVHHLLTHTHGIHTTDEPLAFRPGTKFEYSAVVGFGLVSKIVEGTSKRPFTELSGELFAECGMKNSFHPSLGQHKDLVIGMRRQPDGQYSAVPKMNIPPEYVGSAGFITNAYDMMLWNNALHHGKLLSDSAYKLFIGKHAVREHPTVGVSDYGYGITTKDTAGIVQIGHTGAASGYNALNYYFPKTNTSLVILQNLESDPKNIFRSFYYLARILEVVREREIRLKK